MRAHSETIKFFSAIAFWCLTALSSPVSPTAYSSTHLTRKDSKFIVWVNLHSGSVFISICWAMMLMYGSQTCTDCSSNKLGKLLLLPPKWQEASIIYKLFSLSNVLHNVACNLNSEISFLKVQSFMVHSYIIWNLYT